MCSSTTHTTSRGYHSRFRRPQTRLCGRPIRLWHPEEQHLDTVILSGAQRMVLSLESRDAPRPWEGAGGWTVSEEEAKNIFVLDAFPAGTDREILRAVLRMTWGRTVPHSRWSTIQNDSSTHVLLRVPLDVQRAECTIGSCARHAECSVPSTGGSCKGRSLS